MSLKLSEIKLTPGRLLVSPHAKDRAQGGFEVSESGREISSATVVACGPLDADYAGLGVGSVIVYERFNSEAMVLQDESGAEQMYRFVVIRDVAAFTECPKPKLDDNTPPW